MIDFSLKNKLSDRKFRGLFGLYAGRTTLFISSGLLGIFLPIFFYNIFNQNFQYLIFFYALSHFTYGVLVAYGAQFLNKFGFRKALIWASLWGALFYSALYLIDKGTLNFFFIIIIAFISQLLFRLFYWLPYHIDFAKFTDKKNRGKNISIILATITILSAGGPIIAGFIIDTTGFNILFIIAIVLFIFATIPFSIVPRTKEEFTWSYKETWKRLFSASNRPIAFSLMANGAENVIGIVVWPIFIFLLLNGSYLEVGAISSFIITATVILQLVIGKYLDKTTRKEQILKFGSIMYAIGWVVKIFVLTAFHIFVAGLYHSLTRILTRTTFETMFYELAADQGHYVDEFTVLREMAIQLGKVVTLLLVSIIALFFAIQWTFVIAAVSALLLNVFYMRKQGDLKLV